ncbi:MAG: 50S ribosomal protein L20 [Candidatus Shikimatogenerans bostrichidophilus]|nr:MAG: 50S ribosomal protein L20 [Candidatus Shikimatogenerans bostrichidophilus]
MPRSKNLVASKNKRKKILKLAKGFYGAKKRSYTIAKNSVQKSLLHSYIGRKNKKRVYRKIWILRINAYVRKYSKNKLSYSKFINFLKKKNYSINRKMLSNIIINNKNGNLLNSILKN